MDNVVSEAVSQLQPQLGLITHERIEKFDLLGQLILNQREAVILCGEEGIGKTTLLNTFKNLRESIWVICLLQGRATLDFKQIQNRLMLAIQLRYPEHLGHQDLQSLLNFFEQQQQKVVLIIDDAAKLPAGLVTVLIEYGLQNPVLRLVFSFTREQLYAKNITDRLVDSGYFIEIPALTKSQLTDFLNDLFPDDVQKINDSLLSELYRHTAGIPGKIVVDFPLFVEVERKKTFNSLKSFAVISFFLMSVGLFYFYNFNHDNNLLKTQLASRFVALKLTMSAIKQKVAKITLPDSPINESASIKKRPDVTQPVQVQSNRQIISLHPDQQWLLQQPSENYTLQLMFSSEKELLLSVIKKHPDLQLLLKIVQISSENQDKYVLLYGSFADAMTANQAIRLLPADFRYASPRRFNTLQANAKK